MDRFILWSVSFDKENCDLSFFATQVQVPCINKGTQEMILDMLLDLGIITPYIGQWSIEPFLTNYLVDEPKSDNWEDIWAPTWEIRLKLASPVDIQFKETDLIRTYARDKTWKGELPKMPSKCIVVADFYCPDTLKKAKKILDRVSKLAENTSLIDELHCSVPYIEKEIFINLRNAYLELKALQKENLLQL